VHSGAGRVAGRVRRAAVCGGFEPATLGRVSRADRGTRSRGRRSARGADHRGVRGARAGGEGGGTSVSAANAAGLMLAVGLVVFLVVALLFPERF